MQVSGHHSRHVIGALVVTTGAGLALAPAALAASAHHTQSAHDAKPAHHATRQGHSSRIAGVGRYDQRNLVSDTGGTGVLRDPDLINGWGISFGPRTPAWVSDMGTSKASVYAGGVNGSAITKAGSFSVPGGPTGQVFNGTTGFPVRSGSASGPSTFLFGTVAGTIDGWNPNVPAAGSTDAQTAVAVPGAEFTGLAINGNRLYAADFHNGRVDVWDGAWKAINKPGAFRDSRIPRGYAPFGIESVGNKVVVTYAKQDARAQLDVPGAGHGFVDVYTTSGHLQTRLASRGTLNSPWGVALAPKGFGKASGDMLIGNFGNGRINVFNARSGRFDGQLAGANGKPVTIPGLWAIKFGNGLTGAPNQLLFAAGPGQGQHGLFGELTAATKGKTPTATTPSTGGTGTTTPPAKPGAPAQPTAPKTPTAPPTYMP
ncbi:MAG TPA: TIGR03118 family protein [Conexibacter sp.]|jgi:uncharacterized protein (TIGR03118 family)